MSKRIAVCINENVKTPILLRAAQRKAADLQVPWVAIYIETPHYHKLSDESRERLLRFMTLAEQMGAMLVLLHHTRAVRGVVNYIEASARTDAPIYHVISGRSFGHGIKSLFTHSFAHTLSAKLRKKWEVHIIPLSEDGLERGITYFSDLSQMRVSEVFFVLFSVLGSVLLAELAHYILGMYGFSLENINIAMIFVIASTLAAVNIGFMGGLFASVLSAMALAAGAAHASAISGESLNNQCPLSE